MIRAVDIETGLHGAAMRIIMTGGGPPSFLMTAGVLVVVPRGRWHRFEAAGR